MVMSASKPSTRRPKDRCRFCRQGGHFQRECPRKREMPTQKAPKSTKWCPLHNSTIHSDQECGAQQANTDASTDAETTSETVAKNPVELRTAVDLGPASYVFMAVRPPEAEVIKLPSMIDSDASDHFVDSGLLPASL